LNALFDKLFDCWFDKLL